MRNSRARKVAAQCLEPMSTMSPCQVAMRCARRRRKARRSRSLSSASNWTILRSASAVITSSSPGSATRTRAKPDLPAFHHDGHLSTVLLLDHLELAGDDDKECGRHTALFYEDLSPIDPAPLPHCIEPRNLLGGQSREHHLRSPVPSVA